MFIVQKLMKFNSRHLDINLLINFVLFSRVCFTLPGKSETFIGRSITQSTSDRRMLW